MLKNRKRVPLTIDIAHRQGLGDRKKILFCNFGWFWGAPKLFSYTCKNDFFNNLIYFFKLTNNIFNNLIVINFKKMIFSTTCFMLKNRKTVPLTMDIAHSYLYPRYARTKDKNVVCINENVKKCASHMATKAQSSYLFNEPI